MTRLIIKAGAVTAVVLGAALTYAQSAPQGPADLDPMSRARLPYLQRNDVDERGRKSSTPCPAAVPRASCGARWPSPPITPV
jgi:hypothetical protein